MDNTVREHIRRLKAQIDLVSEQIAENDSTQPEAREPLKAELAIAFLAPAHYEAALKEERELAALAQGISRHH